MVTLTRGNACMDNKLSRRELEVLTEIRKGKTNKGIADSLNICEGTVKLHANSIYRKLGVKNRVQAINFYLNDMNQEMNPA